MSNHPSVLDGKSYDYQPGELVRRRGEPWDAGKSRYAVIDVRGENLLIGTAHGPALFPSVDFEPLQIDPRRVRAVFDEEDAVM